MKGIGQHFRTRWPEWVLALLLLAQCWWLWTKRDFGPAPPYRMILTTLDINTIIVFGATLSVIWLAALTANGTFIAFRRLSPWVRAAAGTCAACYWTMWSVSLYQMGQFVSTVTWVNHAGLALMAGICVVMCAQEVAHADQKARQWKRIRKRTGGR